MNIPGSYRLSTFIYRRFGARYVDCVFDRPVVSFTFDDFPISALTVGGRLLEDFGWRGTYYSSASLWDTQRDVGAIAGIKHLRNAQQAGHEIGCHTFGHVDCGATSLHAMIRDCKKNGSKLAEFDVQNFAFPFGRTRLLNQWALGRMMTSARGTQQGINHLNTDLNNLRAIPISRNSDIAQLRDLININTEKRGWLIFYTHDVDESPSSFGYTPKEFEAILNHVRSASSEVKTIKAALAGIARQPHNADQ